MPEAESLTRPVPILMYHAVTDAPTERCRPLAVRPHDFADQLAYLRDQGFTALTASQLADLRRGGDARAMPERPVVLTFDDGYADFHTAALPALQRYGFTATLFVATDWLAGGAGSAGSQAAPGPMLTWSQVEEVAAAGIEIGGHTHTHPQLDQLPEAAVRSEVTDSKKLLEDRVQQPVASLAYPYGYSDARVRQVVRETGYISAWAVSNVLPRPDHDPFALPRLTMNHATTPEQFRDVVHGRRIPMIYLGQRAKTKGKALYRRSRALAGRTLPGSGR